MHAVPLSLNSVQVCQSLPALHANDYKGIHRVPKAKRGVEAKAKKKVQAGLSSLQIHFCTQPLYTATALERTFIEPGMAKRRSVQRGGTSNQRSNFAHALAAHILQSCGVCTLKAKAMQHSAHIQREQLSKRLPTRELLGKNKSQSMIMFQITARWHLTRSCPSVLAARHTKQICLTHPQPPETTFLVCLTTDKKHMSKTPLSLAPLTHPTQKASTTTQKQEYTIKIQLAHRHYMNHPLSTV